jgi:glycosyltransferase involved in cell wall biosynthesis
VDTKPATRTRLVFWLGSASPHLSAFITGLAIADPMIEVVGVFAGTISPDRHALGWRDPDMSAVTVIERPSPSMIRQIAERDAQHSVHVFGGVGIPLLRGGLHAVAGRGALLGLMSEGRDDKGFRGKLRVLDSYRKERRYRSDVDFVLAIGSHGRKWYRRCGYHRRSIFPWAYFVERSPNAPESHPGASLSQDALTFAFVGRCDHRKGCDLLLEALGRLRRSPWQLLVVGDGPSRSDHEQAANKLRIADRVRFLGVRQNAEVRSILAASDVLVLSSRWDGWGAVVNEGLMAGSRVVCSDRCGASDVVESSGYGQVVESDSVATLELALKREIQIGRRSREERQSIATWSRCLQEAAATKYFFEIVRHVDGQGERPQCPWLSGQPKSIEMAE